MARPALRRAGRTDRIGAPRGVGVRAGGGTQERRRRLRTGGHVVARGVASLFVVQRTFSLVRRGYDPEEVDRHREQVSRWFVSTPPGEALSHERAACRSANGRWHAAKPTQRAGLRARAWKRRRRSRGRGGGPMRTPGRAHGGWPRPKPRRRRSGRGPSASAPSCSTRRGPRPPRVSGGLSPRRVEQLAALALSPRPDLRRLGFGSGQRPCGRPAPAVGPPPAPPASVRLRLHAHRARPLRQLAASSAGSALPPTRHRARKLSASASRSYPPADLLPVAVDLLRAVTAPDQGKTCAGRRTANATPATTCPPVRGRRRRSCAGPPPPAPRLDTRGQDDAIRPSGAPQRQF